jgi:hypothetical protein
MPSGGVSLAASLALLAGAALLLVPGVPAARPLSWDDLIKPLGVGLPVTRGYVLSPPRRGAEHDVVYVARRDPGPAGPAGRVELHILDRGRWRGISETASFGIAWEVPRAGSLVASSTEDARAVTDALVEAIARNDTGFASVDSIPLAGEPDAPPITAILDRLSGVRGALIGCAVALALVLLVSIPRGAIAAGVLLFAFGLSLRLPSLGLPFAADQDVQRLFTGNLPLREIATGMGLKDRHPPLYFFVLHFAERFGQSEAIGRSPAVLAGAIAGPAILLAAAIMAGRVGPAAALAGLAVSVSPELVARSREVSEIPLFALLAIAAASSLVAAVREPRRARLVGLALSHALALYTYYLAPFLVAAHAAVLACLRRPDRRVLSAFAAGILAGLPALALAAVTLARDWSARAVARAFPALAWGEHSPVQMALDMGRIAGETFGAPLLALLLAATVAGIVRANLAVITAAAGTVATCAGIALLSPIARVQAYYITAVLPLAVLALAVAPEPERPAYRSAWRAGLVLALGCVTVPLLGGARALYIPDAQAFMPRFARVIGERPEQTVVTIAHYDKTLLAYYLARAAARPIAWDSVDDPNAKRIEALVMVHALDAGSEEAAARRLDEILAAGPTLVIERDALLLPAIVARLSACEPLLEAPTARLVRCAAPAS